MERFGLVVDGRQTEALSGETFEVRNPANTDEIVGVVARGGPEDVERIVESAQRALRASWWPRLEESRRRGRVLQRFAALVDERKQDLARLLTREQGKVLRESLGEVDSLINTFDYYAGFGGKITGTVVFARDGDSILKIETRRYPIGICAAVLPFNFPVSLYAWKVAPALMAGNAVIVKPASTAPLTEIVLTEMLHEAGVPAGIASLIAGPSATTGSALITHPAVKKVALTGSTETGKAIYAAAAAGLKRLTLELGGSDPTVVCDDADLEVAAETIVRSGRFRNAGQSCTSVKRVYVMERVFEPFADLVSRITRRMRLGNGLEPAVDMGPLNNAQVRDDVERLLQDAVRRGAVVAAGGGRPSGREYERGYFLQPTVLLDVPQTAQIWEEECFGPVLPLMKVADLDEAIDLANASPYGLGSAIWSRDDQRIERFIDRIQAGMVWVNYKPLSLPEAPFGGVKDSGIGRELGAEGLDAYLETKAIRKYVGKALA
ncbi:MAG: aldehyde dehydrogenase family protein [Armatimonadota bacterium]|nr:aldehyde dehydrogenase family protein [Armatimonadota bacterium]MDR7450893.1 aldehyde dehydrogenase family protein [Armatimonadota bacterium]MDR7465815.1 aldehyde dehydrogenase family protein [Armatimonadota bacterium]MDR7493723.1 aldehyde dehydrogenase family protein [Armatimonadota bacterium]MDR7498329.1 aldehyde dehydrogenase family protein [Armatimonadota bacterium]